MSAEHQQDEANDFRWYVLQTYSGYERRAEAAIKEMVKMNHMEDLVQEIFVPGEDVEQVKKGKKSKVHVIYYPGYIFVNMKLENDLWNVISSIPRVAGFLGNSERKPHPLDDSELNSIREHVDKGLHHSVMKEEFEPGQKVLIIGGPFSGFNGKIEEVNTEKGKLRTMISILGRSTPVELDFDKVKPITDE